MSFQDELKRRVAEVKAEFEMHSNNLRPMVTAMGDIEFSALLGIVQVERDARLKRNREENPALAKLAQDMARQVMDNMNKEGGSTFSDFLDSI